MKQLLILIFCIVLSSCKKNDDEKLLYNQILNYRDDLKMLTNMQESYLVNISKKNEYQKKIIDSLHKIETKLEESFERLKYGERTKIIELRNDFNLKYRLSIKFDQSNYNVSDTIFNRLMEVDFLKLKNQFQNKLMFPHGDKFE